MTVIKDMIESIENRLRELNKEIGALTAARDALHGPRTARDPGHRPGGVEGPDR